MSGELMFWAFSALVVVCMTVYGIIARVCDRRDYNYDNEEDSTKGDS